MRLYVFRSLFFVLFFLLISFQENAWADLDLMTANKSVLKINVISREPSYEQPWTYSIQSRGSGSGVIIEGNKILTSAHVISNSISIVIKKANDPNEYRAVVEFIGHQEDLAILKPEDSSLFINTTPIELGDLSNLQDQVHVFGFPEGGDNISITKGIVSRIERNSYGDDHRNQLLSVQIDAAINSGNSGGPIINNSKLVGIAMSVRKESENIGYIVPPPVIKHFLKDYEDARYDGFPNLGIWHQPIKGKLLPEYFGLNPKEGGVLLTGVEYGSSAFGLLHENDIILSIDNVSIARDGSIGLNENLRVDFEYLIDNHFINEKVEIKIIRNKKRINVELPLKKFVQFTPDEHSVRPTYFIYCGFVFMPLTINYLEGWGYDWGKEAQKDLVTLARYGYPTKDKSQPIVMHSVFPHSVNVGYEEYQYWSLGKVNGHRINSMKNLLKAIDNIIDEFVVIELEAGSHNEKIILDANACKKSEKEILENYSIESAKSQNLQ
jgi:S1-C subfamily serine protease